MEEMIMKPASSFPPFLTYVLLHLKGEHKSQVDFVLSFLFFRHRKKNKGNSDGKIEIRRESCK